MPFFKHAIEIDPKFAMAYAALGRMYGDIGESVLAAMNTSKAYELRDRTSDQEKFFITLSYDLQVAGNLEKGQQTCALWVQAYPRAWEPHGLLSGDIYVARGKREESIEEGKIALGIDPDFSIGYANLAAGYLALERLDEAEHTLRRASERKLEIPDFFILRYVIAFLKGDKVGMEHEVALARERRGVDDWMSNSEGFVLAYSGHLEAARKMSQLQRIWLAKPSGGIRRPATTRMRRCGKPCSETCPPQGREPWTHLSFQRAGMWHTESALRLLSPEILLDLKP